MNDIPIASKQWFAMRDLKRANSKAQAYKQLPQLGFDIFTPMKTKISVKGGRRIRESVPIISDLLFVFSTREKLDPIVKRTTTLQYRYIKGGGYLNPLVVRNDDMNRFITAVSMSSQPRFYSPEEINSVMYGATIRMICPGPLNGYEGKLVKIKGSGKKRIWIELPGVLGAAIEISDADFIEIIESDLS